MENNAQELKSLVAKEDESTSQESHERIREVVKTISKMAPWGEMYEEFKIEKITPISKVEEAIIQLNKEMEATIVSQKQENLIKIMI